MAEEVRAQREQDDRSALRVPGSVDERVDERTALVLGDGRREQLLELVDREHEPLARGTRSSGGDELGRLDVRRGGGARTALERRKQAGAEQRRLAAARRPDEREQRRVREPRDELVDEPLTAEEELRVLGLERREPLERADVATARPLAVPVVAGGRSAGSWTRIARSSSCSSTPGSSPSSSFRSFRVRR